MKGRGAILAVLAAVLVASLSSVACRQSGDSESTGDGLHQTAPPLVGMSLEEAEASLENAGYVLGEVTEDAREGREPGEVLAQEPVAGTSLPRGSEIAVTVSK